MIIYAGVIVGLYILGLGYQIGQDDGQKVVDLLVRLAALTPILGRIFGWW